MDILPKRLIPLAGALVAAGLLVAGCSSGGTTKAQTGAVTAETPNTSAPETSKARPDFVPASAVAADPDGAPVWVDEEARTIFATDCDVARQITSQGEKYGPSARDPETSKFTPGYAFICP